MKKALITGGAGFIGFSLAQNLVADGVFVDLLDNFSRGRRDTEFTRFVDSPRVRCITVDLASPGATDALDADYDVIYHFAAIVGVANVIGGAYDTLKLNVDLTTETLRLARRQKHLSAFVFASSSEVYAGSLLAGMLSFPTEETATLALPPLAMPRSSYMLSKLYGEALVHHAGVPGIIIRPHNVYGPRMGTEHVVPELMKRMHEAEPGSALPVYSPTHSRTFCFIDDAVAIVIALSRNTAAVGQAWNVGTEAPEYPIMRVAEIVQQVVGARLMLVPGSETVGSPIRRCPAMAKTDQLTGYARRTSLADGVERTYSWYKHNVLL